MGNEIQVFENEAFGQVRTIMDERGEPWFVAKDVAKVLGYSRPADAIRAHCKGVGETQTPSNGGIQTVKIIPERDVYRLIMRSKLPSAERFEEWVVGEILPSIRKTGGYIVDRPEDTPEEIMARALVVAQDTLKRREERIAALETENAVMKPKAAFVEQYVDASGLVTLTSASKTLGVKRKDLIEVLERDKALFRRGGRLEPYADKVKRGLFEMKAGEKGGYAYAQVYVTPKGVEWIANRYISELA